MNRNETQNDIGEYNEEEVAHDDIDNSSVDSDYRHIIAMKKELDMKKSKFVTSLMKRYSNDATLFNGMNNKSWMVYLRKYMLLGESHSLQDEETLLHLVHWTLGPGPKMFWERFIDQKNVNWDSFKSAMEKRYNSKIIHA